MKFVVRLFSLCALYPFISLLSSCGGSSTATTVITKQPATTPPVLSYVITGPMETVFQHNTQACAPDDIPDDAARAFRDYAGTVHLIAAEIHNYAMLGSDLNHVTRNCNVPYQDGGSADPMAFDDDGWLETYYTPDGKTVYGIVAHDFHPDRHNMPCGTTQATIHDCWYGTQIAATSTDGGYTFTSPPPGAARLIAGSEYVYSSSYTATQGAFVPTNIILLNGYYYYIMSVVGQGVQPSGDCLMRTATIADPHSWRAWDGTGFTIQFVDPATTAVDPSQHVCTVLDPTNLFSWMRNLLVLPDGQGYLGTLYKNVANADGTTNFNTYGTTSLDLIHWSNPVLITSFPNNPNLSTTFYYPSLIDPTSTSMNFETITKNSGYLYYTLFRGDSSNDRDLVRFPVTINGLQ